MTIPKQDDDFLARLVGGAIVRARCVNAGETVVERLRERAEKAELERVGRGRLPQQRSSAPSRAAARCRADVVEVSSVRRASRAGRHGGLRVRASARAAEGAVVIVLLSLGSLVVSLVLVGWVVAAADRVREQHAEVAEANARLRADYERDTAERLASGQAPKPPPCYKVIR